MATRHPNEEFVNIIERTLAQVPRPEGFVSAHLVELGTGQILAGIPAPADPPGPASTEPAVRALAAAAAESLHQLTRVTALHEPDENVEDLVITLTGRHHLVRLLPDLAGADVFLLVTLDRALANLGLARHLLRNLETAVVP